MKDRTGEVWEVKAARAGVMLVIGPPRRINGAVEHPAFSLSHNEHWKLYESSEIMFEIRHKRIA